MPAVAPSSTLATKAYSRVIADQRVTAPALSDREAIAKELSELCEKSLSTEKEKSRRARLHCEIARLHETTLGDLQVALANFQKAHTQDPRLEPATQGLARVRARLGQWEGVLAALDDQAKATARADAQAALLFARATILEMRLDRHGDARADYERALKLVPDETSLLSSVVRCARRDQDWKGLDALLAAQSQTSGADRQLAAARLGERARVAELHRKQSVEAAQFYGQAFETDPMGTAAALSLERLLAMKKMPQEMAQLLKSRAELLKDPASRASALASASAVLAQGLQEYGDAAAVLELAWEAQTDNIAYLYKLEELYLETGNFENLVQTLERIEQRQKEPAIRAELCSRIASILAGRLDRGGSAVRFWERAREIDPTNGSCVSALCSHYEQNGDWGELVTVLSDEEAESKDPVRRAAAHRHIARICEQHLTAADDAIDHYRAALGLVPDDDVSFRELTRLLESARRYEEVVELHERAADAAPNDEVLFMHLFKNGQMLEDLLNAPERALVCYRRILEKQPAHLGALYALQRSAARAGEYDVLVDALVQEAGQHQKAELKVPLLHRAATVCAERLGQDKRALELFNQVLALDPKFAPSLRALADIHQAAGRFNDLVKILTIGLNRLPEKSQKVAQYMRLGSVSEEHLREDEKALGYFKKAFELDQAHAPAVAAIARAMKRLGKFEDLAVFLQERLKKMEAGRQRALVALEVAQIYELRLHKLPVALTSYDAALADAPDLIEAIDGRIRVLEQRSEPKKAAEALAARAETTEDPVASLWARLRQAEILENVEKSPDAAIDAYEAVLDEHPSHAQALTALERLYTTKGDVEAQQRILRLQAQGFQDAVNKKGALRESLRLGETEIQLKAPAEGVEQPPVISDAADVLMSLAPPDLAALRVAELSAMARPAPEDLAKIDRRYIEAMDAPAAKSAYRTRLGEFLEPRNPVQALEKHRPALEVDRENIGAARGVTRVAEVADEADLLLEAAELEASVVRDPVRSASLYVRAAEHLAKAGDSDQAVASLKRALTVSPNSVDAARQLHEILSVSLAFDDLVATLSTAAQACTDPVIAAEHWIAVAKIAADERDDLPAALAALGRVEKAGVKSLPATLEFAELYVRDRQWKKAVAQLNQAVTQKPDPTVLLAVRVRLAEIYHEHLEQMTDASRELREILSVEPEHQGALRRLLAIQMKEKSPAAAETATKLVSVSEGAQKAEALVALGKLQAKAKKKNEAIQAFASAVGIVGLEPPDASQGLRELLEGSEARKNAPASPQTGEAWAGYAKALSTFCEAQAPGQHQARAYLELAKVLGERLKNDEQAIKALQSGLKLNQSESDLRLDLVARLKKNARQAEALPELLNLLSAEPLRGETWVDLVEVYDAMGKNAEAHLATGPLVALGKGNDLQISAWKARKPQPAMLGEGAFGAAELNETLRDGVSLDAMALLEQLAPLLPKVFPADLGALGTSSKAKVGAKGMHPARACMDRVLHCFGGFEVDLYPSETVDRIVVVLTDPVGLVVPAAIADESDAGQVCYLGRFLANIARHAQAVDALSEDELRLLFGAATRLVDPNAKISGVHGGSLNAATKRLTKALPWLSKGRIEDAARRYAAAPVEDIAHFRRALQLSAWRAALVLSDDIAPVAKLQNGASRLMGESDDQVQPLIADLMPYWASSSSVSLRKRVGLL